MGAPKVIAVPTKSYVAINSYKCDKSISPTLCDLGRVSNIAAAVTLPRTANFLNRNSLPQSVRSLPYTKRPNSEVLDCTNSISFHENVPTTTSEITAIATHKKRIYTPESKSSASVLATQSTIKPNLDKNGVSNPHVKRMKYNSTETSNRLSSQNESAANNKNNSVSYPQNTTRNLNTHLPFPHSTIQTLLALPSQRRSQETTAHPHLQRNQHDRLHDSKTPQQHNVQLQQQNQQLRNENVQLQKQLSLFRQLIKNPQRLNQVIARLEQRAH